MRCLVAQMENSRTQVRTFVENLHRLKDMAEFNYADMTRWFGINRVTMVSWLEGVRKPSEFNISRLYYLAQRLDACIRRGTFPMPLHYSARDRVQFLEKIRDGVDRGFSATRPTAGRAEMPRVSNGERDET
jgi:hypothetical protein